MERFGHELKSFRGRISVLIVFGLLMIVLTEIGLSLSPGGLGFGTLWPPCGLYFSALTFAAHIKKDWNDLFWGAALASFVSDHLIHDNSLLITVCFIASNSLSAMCAALVARRLFLGSGSLIGLRDMFVFLGCGLLIQSPLAATFGLLLQSVFWSQSLTWFKWVAWWSSNAIGISCFGIISLFIFQRVSTLFVSDLLKKRSVSTHWITLDGTSKELAGLWTALISISLLLQFALIPPWGLFIINVLFLIWSFRFGILHSSLVLAVASMMRLFQVSVHWQSMTLFSQILLFNPPSSLSGLKVATIISLQLFIIERAVVVNFAAALFTDLHLKQRALLEGAASRERLMARMSHEIRTPLSGVLGLVEAWALKERNQQRANELQMILNSGAQLKRVIDDVLDFSKISAGKLVIEPVRCHVQDLMSEIISLHARDAQSKGLMLELRISEELDEYIFVDALRLRQIMNNLIANSIKFTQKGFVRVGLRKAVQLSGNRSIMRLTVEDSGIGISQSAMKNLFQPFEQIGTETTRAYGGTGLGLAICRELTELLGGRIAVESTRGVGTCFTADIPYELLQPETSQKRASQPPSQSVVGERIQKKKQVLIVEDDLVNQIVAARFVEAEGFSVKIVDNGTQALEMLEHQSADFSLVLMDYFMPSMDGCEVTRRFRSRELRGPKGSHLPIVGLTASVLETDHQRCRQAGMDDVLLKPLERAALRSVLSKFGAA